LCFTLHFLLCTISYPPSFLYNPAHSHRKSHWGSDYMMSETPRALALVGMPGAGKTLCAKHLEAKGYFQFRFGGIVVGEVTRRGWPITPENERIVREELRRDEGMDVM